MAYTPSKKCPVVTFTRHRVLGSELRFLPEVYDERRALFAQRLSSIVNYVATADKCRSSLLLEYFGEKDTAPCGRCDVCVAAHRSTVSDESHASGIAAVEALLADGKIHPFEEFDKLSLSRPALSKLLRHLCDEEKIIVESGGVRVKH